MRQAAVIARSVDYLVWIAFHQLIEMLRVNAVAGVEEPLFRERRVILSVKAALDKDLPVAMRISGDGPRMDHVLHPKNARSLRRQRICRPRKAPGHHQVG